jgi:CMP-N,N'-diacetyllegionaminic acid synthase
MDDIAVIIPARSGSKSIKNKNIKLIASHPLIAYSIASAKLAGVKNIFVSTDSFKFKSIAEKYGASVPFLRPKNISNDKSTDYEFIIHFLNWIKKNSHIMPKLIIHLRPTTPIRDPKIIIKAINAINKKNSTSLRSGHKSPETFMKWFYRNKKGYFSKVHKSMTVEKIDAPRQKFRPVYIPNGYVDIYKSNYILKNKKLLGNKMLVFETPRCIEVDEIFDMQILNSLKSKQKDYLIRYLNKYKKK